MTKVKTYKGQNVLTVENQIECYRIEYKGYDFSKDYKFDVEKVRKSVRDNGIVFTACDYSTFVVVIKRLIK